MFKRIINLFLCFIFIISGFKFVIANSYDSIPVWGTALEVSALPVKENKVDLSLQAKAVILMDESTGTILYEKNSHEKLRPASVTKVMSLLLIMEALEDGKIKLNDKISCSEKARSMGGSQIWLDETEQLTVNEMIKAICVVSANDCTVAMAEAISGSEEGFVVLMNEKAKQLGMMDTTFKNSHGIDEDGHVTSAYDIALMSRELSRKYPKIHEYTSIWMDNLREGKSQLVNTNRLIRFYSGATGLKTGSTSLALYNLSATANRNNLKLIAVIMSAPTSQIRFAEAQKLLDYGFANYVSVSLAKKMEVIDKITLPKAQKKEINIVSKEDINVLLNKGEDKNIVKEKIIFENISAPLQYGEKVGEIKYLLNNNIIGINELIVSEKVKSKGLFHFINDGISFWYRVGR
jgi:D-alanyl-D-alanine carboxypeptidase (penicillin-binding protein 5/6)